MPTKGDLRVWWIRNPPSPAEHIPVINIGEAKMQLKLLADIDLGNSDIICNAGGLVVFDGTEWEDWYDEDGRSIDETP